MTSSIAKDLFREITEKGIPLPVALRLVEREIVNMALDINDYNKTHASALIGIHRTTLIEKLKIYKKDRYLAKTS